MAFESHSWIYSNFWNGIRKEKEKKFIQKIVSNQSALLTAEKQ